MQKLKCHTNEGCGKCCGCQTPWEPKALEALVRARPKVVSEFGIVPLLVRYPGNAHYYLIPRHAFRAIPIRLSISPLEWDRVKLEMAERELQLRRIFMCVFLSSEERCQVYDLRPHVCRVFGEDHRYPCPMSRPEDSVLGGIEVEFGQW